MDREQREERTSDSGNMFTTAGTPGGVSRCEAAPIHPHDQTRLSSLPVLYPVCSTNYPFSFLHLEFVSVACNPEQLFPTPLYT